MLALNPCSIAKLVLAGRLCGSGCLISSTAPIRSPQRWRVDVFFAMLAIGIVWLLWLNAPRRDLGAIYFFVILPVSSFILLTGWAAIGLQPVDTVCGAACW